MEYARGQKVYFQFHSDFEDETWYPGTIVKHSDYSKCYEIIVKGLWRHFFAPPERIKPREEDLNELMVWEQLWNEAHYCSVLDTGRSKQRH